MANTLGDLSLRDMKWLGDPLDAVGEFQKGVNLVEQKQRIQQSSDMHPLKIEATKAQTNLLHQQGTYNARTMDSRVSLSDSVARIQATTAAIKANTQPAAEQIINAAGQVAEFDANERSVNNDLYIQQRAGKLNADLLSYDTLRKNQADRLSITESDARIAHAKAENASGSEKARRELTEQQTRLVTHTNNLAATQLQRQLAQQDSYNLESTKIDGLTPEQLGGYFIPSIPGGWNTKWDKALKAQLTGRQQELGYTNYKAANAAANAVKVDQATEDTKIGSAFPELAAVLSMTNTMGKPLFNAAQLAVKQKQVRQTAATYGKLSKAGRDEVKAAMVEEYKAQQARQPSGGHGVYSGPTTLTDPGAVFTVDLGSVYGDKGEDGIPVLSRAGTELAKEILAKEEAGRMDADIMLKRLYGLEPASYADGKMKFEKMVADYLPQDTAAAVLKQADGFRERWIETNTITTDGVTQPPPSPTNKQEVAFKAKALKAVLDSRRPLDSTLLPAHPSSIVAKEEALWLKPTPAQEQAQKEAQQAAAVKNAGASLNINSDGTVNFAPATTAPTPTTPTAAPADANAAGDNIVSQAQAKAQPQPPDDLAYQVDIVDGKAVYTDIWENKAALHAELDQKYGSKLVDWMIRYGGNNRNDYAGASTRRLGHDDTPEDLVDAVYEKSETQVKSTKRDVLALMKSGDLSTVQLESIHNQLTKLARGGDLKKLDKVFKPVTVDGEKIDQPITVRNLSDKDKNELIQKISWWKQWSDAVSEIDAARNK